MLEFTLILALFGRFLEARTLLVLLNTFSLVLLTAQKLAAVGQPEDTPQNDA